MHQIRRKFILLLFIATIVQITNAQKKNVLFLMADDLNYWTSKNGYYPQAKTPNIDKLADMGVFFREAHCSSPVCNPSRNALWSGLRPSTTGIDANGDGFIRDKKGFENVVTMNQYFMQNGYWVYGAGKLYHPKMSKSNHETDPENWSYINEHAHGCAGGSVYKFCNSAKTNYCFSANPDEMTRSNCGDYNISLDVKELIESYPTSPQKDMPFFIACGVFRPHMPWNSPLSFWNLFNYDSLTKPPAYNPELDDPGNAVHQDFVKNDQWMRAIQAYLASCALSDNNVGIMVDALMNSPYKDNTIIVFCGDHGWNLGEKGRWGKFDRCDEANHTTLIIYDPTAEGNGKECIKPVSLQDLYPTLIDLCGLPPRQNVEGNSLQPLLENPDGPNVKSFALMMYGDINYIKTEKWRFIDDGVNSILNNNQTDPYQWHNLYGQSEYNVVVDSLRHQIDSVVGIGTNLKQNYYETMPPVLPSNLEAKAISSKAIQISWTDNSNNEMGFNVYRQVNGVGDFNLLHELAANTEYYIDKDVSEENTYAYFIEVYNVIDTIKTAPVSGIQPENVKPEAPSNLVAYPIDVNQIDLSWEDNSLNESHFEVYRKESSTDDFVELVSLAANVSVYSDTNVNGSKLYSYYVAALNETGSANSNIVENIKPEKISYPALAYEDSPWQMPGSVVEAWKYDKAGTGSNWEADSSVTIGLYRNVNDGKGQDKRNYGNACPYPAARWNGGSNTMRDNGQWMRYTCKFDKGEYEFKIRGRNSAKQIKLTLRNSESLQPVFTTMMNYPDDFENLGEGGDGSGVSYWYQYHCSIAIEAGTYIVELEVADDSSGGILGEFTFIKTDETGDSSLNPQIKGKSRVLLNNYIKDNYIDLDLTKLNPAVWIRIVNLQGKTVQEQVIAGEEFASIEVNPALPKGMYMLYIDDSEFKTCEKFVLR